MVIVDPCFGGSSTSFGIVSFSCRGAEAEVLVAETGTGAGAGAGPFAYEHVRKLRATPGLEEVPVLLAVDANYCGSLEAGWIASLVCSGASVSVLRGENERVGFVVTATLSSAPPDVAGLVFRARGELAAI